MPAESMGLTINTTVPLFPHIIFGSVTMRTSLCEGFPTIRESHHSLSAAETHKMILLLMITDYVALQEGRCMQRILLSGHCKLMEPSCLILKLKRFSFHPSFGRH
ncbi:hypothetical protein CDAR_454561 [Caerostris darwini]|uniref:Uncharacterized protein n=1 Tax=Caerostris darwini TaxID=1538125 RepID=A0AAV4TZ58_9ARAC|nr:hypothetical protein CDAR_454561 [Caerostris darwini]